MVVGVVSDLKVCSNLSGRRAEGLGLFHSGEHGVPVPSGSVGTGELSPGVDFKRGRSDATKVQE